STTLKWTTTFLHRWKMSVFLNGPAVSLIFRWMSVQLTESLLSKAAGWEAMKRARAYLAQGHVLSSNWTPPLLRGVVDTGEVSIRASLVIKSDDDIENLCT